jgi:hypothetical protein
VFSGCVNGLTARGNVRANGRLPPEFSGLKPENSRCWSDPKSDQV